MKTSVFIIFKCSGLIKRFRSDANGFISHHNKLKQIQMFAAAAGFFKLSRIIDPERNEVQQQLTLTFWPIFALEAGDGTCAR